MVIGDAVYTKRQLREQLGWSDFAIRRCRLAGSSGPR